MNVTAGFLKKENERKRKIKDTRLLSLKKPK
jgi:hypothetical protein